MDQSLLINLTQLWLTTSDMLKSAVMLRLFLILVRFSNQEK